MIVDTDKITANSQLIVSMVNLALENLSKKQVQTWKKNLSHNDFRSEFGTVKISLPRRAGHSTAALQLLFEHPGSLVIVYNHQEKSELVGMFRKLIDDPDIRKRVEDAILPVASVFKPSRRVETKTNMPRPLLIIDQAVLFREEILDQVRESFQSTQLVVELH